MHPTFLCVFLGSSIILQACTDAATITSNNMAPVSDTEPDHNAINTNPDGKWDADMEILASYLEQLLREGELWNLHENPLLYVEDMPPVIGNEVSEEDDDPMSIPWKRSRYYRRYPWKRQNGRHRTQYADASRYMCNPTREDVFQLLVALHEAREGNTRRTVNFCNRKRPASTIFTNIRFLGRRK